MKVWSSFLKELKIASRGFYFYIEIFMALLIVGLLLFIVPDQFNQRTSEYVFLDLPMNVQKLYLEEVAQADLDGIADTAKIDIAEEEKYVPLYITEEKKVYILPSRSDLESLAEEEQKFAIAVVMDENYQFDYEYHLQGYESSRFKNLIKMLNIKSSKELEDRFNQIEIQSLAKEERVLTDKENLLPAILVFNGALMGLFIIAAYIFLDKEEGVIQAYAVSPSPVWQYLLSKIGVILLTTIVSTLLIVFPLMLFQINYLLLLVLLLTTAFFASALGLVIASFYENIIQAFGTIYAFIMLMLVPTIAYFMPSWNPTWVKYLPSYPMLEAFQAILLGNQSTYVLRISLVFAFIGLLLFFYANHRYQKNLVN